jgi:hypothetical protein
MGGGGNKINDLSYAIDFSPLLPPFLNGEGNFYLYIWESEQQRVTKRCRLSWLTNSALVYEPKCGGGVLRGLSQ